MKTLLLLEVPGLAKCILCFHECRKMIGKEMGRDVHGLLKSWQSLKTNTMNSIC
jgi:hypothetical protein